MKTIKGFKGFDKDLKCRDFQYEIGKEYETDKVKCCETGFHFCENPFDVFAYYPPTNGNRFGEVEGGGNIDTHDEDSKVSVTKIKINAELNLKDLINSFISFVFEKTKVVKETIATNGDYANAATNGNKANAATNGYKANAATNGNYANAATNGDKANAATNGNYANAATNGYKTNAATNGYKANAATNGNYANAATNGNYANAATNGEEANAATNGYKANAATNGNKANAATNGNYANAATNGNYANAEVNGKESIASGLGINNKAKGALNNWLVLSEWAKDENYNWHIKSVKSVKIDGKKIKENTWYALKRGKFIQCKD
jgi:hypothetical protein